MRWLASLAILAACHATPEPPAPSCKVSTPACDPSVTDTEAVTLVERRCAGCHADGGKASHPLLAPELLRAERENVALRLAGCEMPPDNTPLPAAERARLIHWAACRQSPP